MSLNHLSPLSAEEQEIKSIIERRNIQWLCHFTPRENLDRILENGLLQRNELNAGAIKTDIYRYDSYSDAICLSISKPNKWMFEKKRTQGFDLCLLLIKPEILFKKKCLFFPHNAATACYRYLPIDKLSGGKALEGLFSDPVSFQKSGCVPKSIPRIGLSKQETTSDQAEVQCLENIEPSYIIGYFADNIPLTYDDFNNCDIELDEEK